MNSDLRAEITYRDGERRAVDRPRLASRFHLGQVDRATGDLSGSTTLSCKRTPPRGNRGAAIWSAANDPEMTDADRGADPGHLSGIRNAAGQTRPWPSIRDVQKFDEGWVLTIEKFE